MTDLATALRNAAARGAVLALNIAPTRDGRWQASRQNPDGSFAIRVDADIASAVLDAVEAWSAAPPLSEPTTDNDQQQDIFA